MSVEQPAATLNVGQKQRLFVRLLPRLIDFAYAKGFELTLGEATRSDEQAEINAMGFPGREALASMIEDRYPVLAAKIRNNTGNGIRYTLHEKRLALDLNLFRNGAYMADAETYRPIGEFWESLHPLCTWGGRFGDADHFSITDGGIK